MKKLLFSLILLISVSSQLRAQRDLSWQNDYEDITDWAQYLTISPGFMGPFALFVPEIHTAEILEKKEVEGGYAHYKCQLGEAPTNAITTRTYIPLAKNRVALEITLMANEHYKYSDEMANYFRAKNTSGSGGGDFYINTYIKLLEQSQRRPDIVLRYGMRTSSGQNMKDARHNDAAGYYFDLSFGKDVYTSESVRMRYYALGGFHAWQLLNFENYQNDAYMYGIGMLYEYNDIRFKWDFGGYSGYRNEGDQPVIMRVRADIPLHQRFTLSAKYEYGFRDFPYTGYLFNLIYRFD